MIEIKYHMPVMIPPSKINGFRYSDNRLTIIEVGKIEDVIATYLPPSAALPGEKKKVGTAANDLWEEIENSVNFSSFTRQAPRSGADNVDIFKRIKHSLTILEYLSITSKTKFISIPCPMHEDNKPSLAINSTDNVCKCYNQCCPLSYQWFDVIGLHAILKQVSNIEAAKELLRDYCV